MTRPFQHPLSILFRTTLCSTLHTCIFSTVVSQSGVCAFAHRSVIEVPSYWISNHYDMIGTSTIEYIFIRLSIYFLRLIAPASIFGLVASALAGRLVLGPWLTLLAASEAAFYLCFYLPRRESLQKLDDAVTESPLTRSERQALFNRCATCLPDGTYPMGWFLAEDIKRDNIIEWLLWALFSTTLESAQLQQEWPEWNKELSGYVDCIEKLVNRKFESGRDSKTRSMRIAFDRVLMCHRPLVWYAVSALQTRFPWI